MQNVAQTSATRNNMEDTGPIPVLFEATTTDQYAKPQRQAAPDYLTIQHSEEFRRLRARFRRFVFPMTLLFIVWYFAYVLLAAYAHELMATKVYGQINVAILLGIGQFVSTALITIAYLRFARRRLDPQAEKVRQQAGV
jgi:uncharacterized membrane protein (DUF485 family)